MFGRCYELEYLDLSNFDTSNVTNMISMFVECNKLKEIKGLNKFNTKNVIDISGMFAGCSSLKKENVKISNNGKRILDEDCLRDVLL